MSSGVGRRGGMALCALLLGASSAIAGEEPSEPSKAEAQERFQEVLGSAIADRGQRGYEIRNLGAYLAIVEQDWFAALLCVDRAAREAFTETGDKSFARQRLRAELLKNHVGVALLQDLRKRLIGARQYVYFNDGNLEFDRQEFRLRTRMDDSRRSADRLALGIIVEVETEEADTAPGLSIGAVPHFACWDERVSEFEALHQCGIKLPGMPTEIGAQVEKGTGGGDDQLQVRWAWRGLPQVARAKTVLIRGMGYLTRKVLAPRSIDVDFVQGDRVLWSFQSGSARR